MTLQRRAKKRKTTFREQIHNGENTFFWICSTFIHVVSSQKYHSLSCIVWKYKQSIWWSLATSTRWSYQIFVSDICNTSSFLFTFALFWSSMRIMIWWLGCRNPLWYNDRVSGLIAPIYSMGVILWGGAWLGNHCYSTVAARKNALH